MAQLTRLQKAQSRLCITHPFFATLVMGSNIVVTTDIPTMATDMKNIYINPDFFESLTDKQQMTGLAHETCHDAFLHGIQGKGYDQMIANMAMDYCINIILRDEKDKQGNLMFEPIEGWLCDDKYKGMSWQQVYDLLIKQRDKARKNGQSGQPGDGMPDFGGLGSDVQAPHSSGNPAEEAKAKRQMEQRVAQAASMARMQGRLSGDLERIVGEMLDPKVPWKDLLRDYMTRQCKDDESWSRRNRRFANVYLPARYSEKMGEICLIGDTSGSISNEELCKYMAEANSIIEDVAPEQVRILWCDTKVAGEQLFESGEPLDPKPKGGGGTDMRVAITAAEKYEPEVIVLFTDGYTPYPEVEPDMPLIVCCTTDAPVPVGYVVRI